MNRLPAVAAVIVIASLAAGCHGATSPSNGATEPSPSFNEPTQVSWSATAANAAGCAGVPNSWTWNITVTENAGVGGMTVDYLDSVLDNVAQPRLTIATALNAKGHVTVARAICLSTATQHFVQDTIYTSFKGAQSIDGTTVTLLAKP